MATHMAPVSESVGQRLPLRELGFEHVPAVPVDIDGMLDSVVKLGIKSKQYEQPLHGLSKTYTIGGSTARAYNFLYGGEGADAKRGAACERLRGFLSRNSSEIYPSLAAEKLDLLRRTGFGGWRTISALHPSVLSTQPAPLSWPV